MLFSNICEQTECSWIKLALLCTYSQDEHLYVVRVCTQRNRLQHGLIHDTTSMSLWNDLSGSSYLMSQRLLNHHLQRFWCHWSILEIIFEVF